MIWIRSALHFYFIEMLPQRYTLEIVLTGWYFRINSCTTKCDWPFDQMSEHAEWIIFANPSLVSAIAKDELASSFFSNCSFNFLSFCCWFIICLTFSVSTHLFFLSLHLWFWLCLQMQQASSTRFGSSFDFHQKVGFFIPIVILFLSVTFDSWIVNCIIHCILNIDIVRHDEC